MQTTLASNSSLDSVIPSIAAQSPDDYTKAIMAETAEKEPEYLQEELRKSQAERKKLELKNDLFKDYLNSLEPERSLRNKYTLWLFIGVGAYLLVVLSIAACNPLPSVLTMLVGTTTINVLALLIIVLKFVFNNHHHRMLEKL